MNDLDKYFDIMNAIKRGNMQKVIDIVDEFGLSFCSLLDDGYQLLTVAVEKDQVEMVANLLHYNAKVNSDRDVMSLLQIAAINNNTTIFKMLLERGATISYSHIYNKKSPIKLAVENNNIEIVRLIIQHKNFGKKYDPSLLHMAIKNNSLEMVSLLLEAGADVNEYDDNGSAPIHHAVKAHDTDILQLLLDYGADINAKNKSGDTPVCLVLMHCYSENPIMPSHGAVHIVHSHSVVHAVHSSSVVHILPNFFTDSIPRIRIIKSSLEILLDNDADINSPHIRKYVLRTFQGMRMRLHANDGVSENKKCIIKHIVKLKSRNAPLSTAYDELLSSFVEHLPCDSYKKMCEQEIKKIIAEKIPNSGISFHNVLSKNSNFLAAYAKNENHQRFIFSDEVLSRFPIYGSAIKLRFSKGLARKNLLEKSTKLFQNLFPVACKLLSYGVDNVFECLDNNDLKNFLRKFQQYNLL